MTSQVQNNNATLLFVAGAMGGFAEGMVVQPLDMIKTRFHLSSKPNPSVLSALKYVYNEGGVARFYRGVLPELAGMVPKTSIMYTTQQMVKNTLSSRQADGKVTGTIAAASGFASGITEALTVQPFQVIKVRLQAKEHLGRYKNTLHCARTVLQTEGIGALLLTGLEPTLWRNCMWNTVYFGSMFYVKENFLPDTSSKAVDLLQTLVSGIAGGSFATCFNAPFDVAKSRIQSQIPGAAGKQYRFALPLLRDIYRAEGVAALYKGFQPKVLRMGLGGGVCMCAFEASYLLLQSVFQQDE
jgi:solute carrier family 25 2-oxodicarboxylate transporter 21